MKSVSTGQHVKAPRNDAVPRRFADTARPSPSRPLASVGLTEEQARAQHLRFRVAQADISDWYSARRLKEDAAAFKVLIEEQTNRLLGAHIILAPTSSGPNADETINLFALAIRLDLPTNKMRELVLAYPSQQPICNTCWPERCRPLAPAPAATLDVPCRRRRARPMVAPPGERGRF